MFFGTMTEKASKKIINVQVNKTIARGAERMKVGGGVFLFSRRVRKSSPSLI